MFFVFSIGTSGTTLGGRSWSRGPPSREEEGSASLEAQRSQRCARSAMGRLPTHCYSM